MCQAGCGRWTRPGATPIERTLGVGGGRGMTSKGTGPGRDVSWGGGAEWCRRWVWRVGDVVGPGFVVGPRSGATAKWPEHRPRTGRVPFARSRELLCSRRVGAGTLWSCLEPGVAKGYCPEPRVRTAGSVGPGGGEPRVILRRGSGGPGTGRTANRRASPRGPHPGVGELVHRTVGVWVQGSVRPVPRTKWFAARRGGDQGREAGVRRSVRVTPVYPGQFQGA